MTYRVTVHAAERIDMSVRKGRSSIKCADKGEALYLLGQVKGTDQYLVSVQDRTRPLLFKAKQTELTF